jgi:proteasome lid subunit RPN8/RPN11
MLRNDWTFSLAVYRDNGAPIGHVPIEVDFEPARQWVRHVALCRGVPVRERGTTDVRPIWRGAVGPSLGGFQVAIETDDSPGEVSIDFPAAYFRSVAQAAVGPLVASGSLTEGDVFRYVALASPRSPDGQALRPPGFLVQEVTPTPVLLEASLGELRRSSVPIGDAAADEAPVFAPRRTVDEIAALTRRAGALETGGALVGHLYRDPAARAVFAIVTDQLPARHTEASAVRLRFTSDTWSDLHRTIDARGRHEVVLGWWHSHPVSEWCRQDRCLESVHDRCASATACFSEHDGAVHRTVFPGAHSVAVVASLVSAVDVTFSVFGWSVGMLAPRSLCVT